MPWRQKCNKTNKGLGVSDKLQVFQITLLYLTQLILKAQKLYEHIS